MTKQDKIIINEMFETLLAKIDFKARIITAIIRKEKLDHNETLGYAKYLDSDLSETRVKIQEWIEQE